MNHLILSFVTNSLAFSTGFKKRTLNFTLFLIMIMLRGPFLQAQYCDYLDYFRPETGDHVLEVKLRFVVFKPSVGTGVWDHYTQNDFKTMVDYANTTFSNVGLPNHPSNAPYFPDTKIKLVFDLYYQVDDIAYNKVEEAYQGTATTSAFVDDRICVFLGNNPGGQFNFAATPSGAPNYIRMIDATTNTNLTTPDYGKYLAHEVGHMFGLPHAHTMENYPYISFNFGCACTGSGAADYTRLNYSTGITCTTGVSNNLMNIQDGCYQYLSPGQMSIIHYKLRTTRLDWLTPASYSLATERNAALDHTVTTSQTWTTPRYYKGNVVVPNGVQLVIQCQVGMTTYGKFIIKRGGHVVVNTGGKITNISGRLWEGIDVEGNPAINQSPGNLSSHGQLWILDGGTLEYSINAARNYCYDQNGNWDWSTTGGIIYGSNGIFLNNVRDVEFLSYNMNWKSASKFEYCDFKATTAFRSSHQPYTHVTLYSINGVEFNGCNFENHSSFGNVGEGIHSGDAIYKVREDWQTPSTFKNLDKGVSVINSNPLRSVEVYNSQFINNLKGVTYSNVHNGHVSGNTFSMSASGYGVYLNDCKNYIAASNTISSSSQMSAFGIYASYSGTGAHKIYRNQFTNLHAGILPQFDNSGTNNVVDGLKMNCNVFNAGTSNIYDIAMLGVNSSNPNLDPTVALYQANQNASTFDKVRNQYGATCTTSGEKRWFINVVKKPISHPSNSSPAAMQPTPQPNCSDPAVSISSGPSFIFNNHCVVTEWFRTTGSGPLYDKLTEAYGDAKSRVIQVKGEYDELIDGGDTPALLEAIANESTGNAAKLAMMLSYSPYLSDAALIAYITNSSVLPAEVVDVHNANKPVSAAVWSSILARGFSSGIMTDLNDQQGEYGLSARSAIDGELATEKFSMQHLYAQRINYFIHDTLPGAQDSVIRLLAENEGGIPDAKVKLAQAYSDAGYFERAFAYSDSLQNDPVYEEIMTLQIGLLQLDTARAKMYRLATDTVLRELVESYANDSLKAGSWRARAALNQVFGTNMKFIFLSPPDDPAYRLAPSQPEAIDQKKLIDEEQSHKVQIFPNPNRGSFKVFYFDEEQRPCDFLIRDLLGRTLSTGTLKTNGETSIHREDLPNGIFFITLIQEGHIIKKEKMIIMKE